MDVLAEVAEGVERGDAECVLKCTRRALDGGTGAKEILDKGLLAGMAVVGDRFKAHEIVLPDVLLAAKAMNVGMDELRPLLADEGGASIGRVVLGTVQGDLHDIGKNLVGIMLKGAGIEVIDLGNDVSPERFVETAVQQGAGVIGMSALLTTTMPAMRAVVDLVKARGLSDSIKTIVGGAPVSRPFADEIGADAHGFDAACAVDRVKGLLGGV